MKTVVLKLGTHMDNGLLYHVYQNQGHGPIAIRITFPDRYYNLPSMKKFHHLFLKNCKDYKVET